jgi:lipoate---protein ligase
MSLPKINYLDLTFPDPAENLACDEALLDACEAGGEEVLRFWEPNNYFVVVGYANQINLEVNVQACREQNVPILRRCSGGGTVLQGPGCLNYTLILKIDEAGPLESISSTNRHVMDRNKAALASILGPEVQIRGYTDLVLGNLKFSGNAQRRKRNALIFHGTFLLNFDLPLVERLLAMPSKQPDYRQNRPHKSFLTNLNLRPEPIKAALKQIWNASEMSSISLNLTPLMAEKYGCEQWHKKF